MLEKLIEVINKENLDEESKEYFTNEIKTLTDNDKQAILELIKKMQKAGFKNNFSSAFSEITENIPQFARCLFLKELHRICRDIETNCNYADDLDKDDDWEDLFNKFN